MPLQFHNAASASASVVRKCSNCNFEWEEQIDVIESGQSYSDNDWAEISAQRNANSTLERNLKDKRISAFCPECGGLSVLAKNEFFKNGYLNGLIKSINLEYLSYLMGALFIYGLIVFFNGLLHNWNFNFDVWFWYVSACLLVIMFVIINTLRLSLKNRIKKISEPEAKEFVERYLNIDGNLPAEMIKTIREVIKKVGNNSNN